MGRGKFLSKLFRKALHSNPKGATLIEVLAAVVVLSMILASIPPVLMLLMDAEFKHNESRIAESLARCQIEYIKSSDYIQANDTNPSPEYPTVPVPNDSYEIEITAIPVNVHPEWSDEEQRYIMLHEPFETAGRDNGIQEVTVTIYHVGNVVLSTKNYKVSR